MWIYFWVKRQGSDLSVATKEGKGQRTAWESDPVSQHACTQGIHTWPLDTEALGSSLVQSKTVCWIEHLVRLAGSFLTSGRNCAGVFDPHFLGKRWGLWTMDKKRSLIPSTKCVFKMEVPIATCTILKLIYQAVWNAFKVYQSNQLPGDILLGDLPSWVPNNCLCAVGARMHYFVKLVSKW